MRVCVDLVLTFNDCPDLPLCCTPLACAQTRLLQAVNCVGYQVRHRITAHDQSTTPLSPAKNVATESPIGSPTAKSGRRTLRRRLSSKLLSVVEKGKNKHS